MSNLPVGTLLHGGTYKIIRQISSGGFGVTYEAEHVMLRKHVAIKEFFVRDFCNRDNETSHVTVGTQSKVALVSKLKKKFIDEAIAISRLDHRNIVKVSDVFEDNGTAYYVMDYINGLSLADMVKRDGKLPEKQALKYILQVSDALRYVHSHNRLHLDIKPGNIMVDSKDNAILIDFGASKQYDEENGENTSTLLGKTPGFAPIEQMGNTVQKFTPATDIYALGATLYKLVTGITPPEATSLASGEELPPIGDEISENTRSAILQAMQINKVKRPQSIGEFVNLLKCGTVKETHLVKEKVAAQSEENTIVDMPSEEKLVETLQKVVSTPKVSPKVQPVYSASEKQTPHKNNHKAAIVGGISVAIIAIILFVVYGNYFLLNSQERQLLGEWTYDNISKVDSTNFYLSGRETGTAEFNAKGSTAFKSVITSVVDCPVDNGITGQISFKLDYSYEGKWWIDEAGYHDKGKTVDYKVISRNVSYIDANGKDITNQAGLSAKDLQEMKQEADDMIQEIIKEAKQELLKENVQEIIMQQQDLFVVKDKDGEVMKLIRKK